jgi:hypothetical protein
MSEFAQRRLGFQLDRFDNYSEQDDTWHEIIIADKRATPAEIVACKVDFADWLDRLPLLRRQIALMLSTGATTMETAKQFGVSPGRISQIRLWLKENWDAFQSDAPREKTPTLAVA